MLVIGENIHVLSSKVKAAFAERDAAFIQDLAVKQVQAGAGMLDLNIGPAKKTGVDTMTWLVETVQQVVDVPLSLDTTNSDAIEAGLKMVNKKAMINSTSADPARIAAAMPVAAKYNANLVALTLGATGMPANAEDRVNLAMEIILPAAEQYGVPVDNLYLDPLILTVNGMQDQPGAAVEAVRFFKALSDPAPLTTVGLSNCSNTAPAENRSLINRTFLVMLMGAGLDSAIADPLDSKLMENIRIVEQRDDSTPVNRLILALHDAYAAGEDIDPSVVDMSDLDQVAIWKTIRILQNKVIYAHSYLQI